MDREAEEEFYEFLDQTNKKGESFLHIFNIDSHLSLCTQEESFIGGEITRSKATMSSFLKKFEEEQLKDEVEPPYILEEIAYLTYLLRFEKESSICPFCVASLYKIPLEREE